MKKFTNSNEFRSKNEIEWTLAYQNVLVPTDVKTFDTDVQNFHIYLK